MTRRKHKAATPRPRPAPRTAVPAAPATPVPAATPDSYRDSLPVRHRHAAGIDVGSRSHWAAALGADGVIEVEEFDTNTDGLHALAAWLRQRGVTTVALEATGICGDPLFDLLQAEGFEVFQVNPAYTAQNKGPAQDR